MVQPFFFLQIQLLESIPVIGGGFAGSINRCRIILNEPSQEAGAVDFGGEPGFVARSIGLTIERGRSKTDQL
jgi:hypothetical protein